MGNPQDGQQQRKERAVVARGRTIMAPTSEKRLATHTPEGKPVYAPIMKMFGPGEDIELPMDEIKWLRGTGHLIDPKKIIAEPSQGAHVMEQA